MSPVGASVAAGAKRNRDRFGRVISPSPPVPDPEMSHDVPAPLDPTRYGDWEKKGIAIDF